MQAASRACCGTRASSSEAKSTCVHQQGPCGVPVARSRSIAHAFGSPHKGHKVGVTGAEAAGTAAV